MTIMNEIVGESGTSEGPGCLMALAVTVALVATFAGAVALLVAALG
jgi:hypothetical protein